LELLGVKMPALVGKTVNQAHFSLPNSTRYVYLNHKAKVVGMIIPTNWKICKQDPAPGAKTPDTVTLTIIKRGETCPVSH